MLLIEVDVLEAFLQYEVVSDGKVILKHRDDTICDVDPFFCNLPAGGKLPSKRATEKKKKRKKMRIKEMKKRKKGRKKLDEKKRKKGRKKE